MAPPSASISKKRKRDDSPARDDITCKVAESSKSDALGPVLVSFPALKAPESTTFKCYSEGGKVDTMKLVVGETPQVEFVSNHEESREAASSGCQYLLAVHDPRTSSLKIVPTQKSPYILGRTVKRLKSLPTASEPSALAYREARTKLGETFGTKKAKAAIRAEERNRVDVSAMQGVMSHVMEGIQKGAEGLLTAEQAKQVEDSNRLIPPFDDNTSDPAEIYPLHNIVPEAEWRVIDTSKFEAAKSFKDKTVLLPSAHPTWIQGHVKVLDASTNPKAAKKKWKTVYYVSALFTLRRVMGSKRMEKQIVHQKMKGVPALIVDGLLSRFTETSRDSEGHTLTSGMDTKLLSYMFALCLRADEYMSNPELIAKDLSLPTPRVQELFKSLGCKIKKPTDRELSNAGLGSSLKDTKMAVLKAPVEFPKTARRKARR
ncbi:DNA-directed RNA polymerase I subunit rpa49 [Marasmius crinis-equi]|uniref:DNA-directed RNA polymerase I subunit rpa49 n=1 Tax=Marasmius crinis-equi TaxID=585013 RepID=A0ABR3FJ24_9AGAR